MITKKNGNTFEELSEQAISYAIEKEIDTIIIFAKGIDNVLKLKKIIADRPLRVIATTFPMNQAIYMEDEHGEVNEIFPEIYADESRKALDAADIQLVSASMPLEPVVIPGNQSSPYNAIKQTLNLFGAGVDLVIQSALMTTDSGRTKPGQRVVSMNNTLFVDLNTTNSRFLFHPEKSLIVNQIIK